MKVLVVDDQAQNRALLDALLKAQGHTVTTAGNGVEALEKLRRLEIDLIVSDILMPKMDGYQLCQSCKQDDALASIPLMCACMSTIP